MQALQLGRLSLLCQVELDEFVRRDERGKTPSAPFLVLNRRQHSERKTASRGANRSSHSWQSSETKAFSSSLNFRPRISSATSFIVSDKVSERVKEVIRTQDLIRLHAVERRRRKAEERRLQEVLLERKKREESELRQKVIHCTKKLIVHDKIVPGITEQEKEVCLFLGYASVWLKFVNAAGCSATLK